MGESRCGRASFALASAIPQARLRPLIYGHRAIDTQIEVSRDPRPESAVSPHLDADDGSRELSEVRGARTEALRRSASPPRSMHLTWMNHRQSRVLERYYAIGRGRRDIRNVRRNF
jgi:hypothetical protein